MDKYGNTTDQLRAGVRAMREMADSGFDISKEISEVRELAKEKVAAFKDFREKVEKVVEYNQNLRCALAEAIAENERLKTKINWLEEGIEGVVGLVYKHVDDMSELYAEAERLDDLKEALK